MRRILIVDAVEWGPEHRDLPFPKDVAEWIGEAFGAEAARFEPWRIREGQPAPQGPFAAVVLSGSPASAYDPDPWIGELSERIRGWAADRTPMLGICFGHQIIAHALGGRVEKNPKGWEVGSLEVRLTPAGRADPFFEGVPPAFVAMESHQDVVTQPPPGGEVLAENAMSACQAMRIGDRIRTAQFHPEYTPERLRFILEPRRARLERAGVDMDAALATIAPAPQSRGIVANFARKIALP